MNLVITRASKQHEIVQIKALQTKNLKHRLSPAELGTQGFVTAEYSMAYLEGINAIEPAIIAKDGDTVVGYVLAVTKQSFGQHPLMDDLITQLNLHSFNGKPLAQVNYVVVGQLCVDRAYRGQNLARRMYNYYRDELCTRYELCATDVDEQNQPSLKAHLKTGFQIIGTLSYGGSNWHIVVWDWESKSKAA